VIRDLPTRAVVAGIRPASSAKSHIPITSIVSRCSGSPRGLVDLARRHPRYAHLGLPPLRGHDHALLRSGVVMDARASEARIAFLDKLRGLAAALVFVQHAADHIILESAGAYLRPLFVEAFDAGRFGVALFFIISGYVVPLSIKGPMAIRSFVVGRVFRLYPAYWLSIFAALAVFYVFKGFTLPWQQVVVNMTMLEALFGVPFVLGPYWTLIIELAFYFFAALLYKAGKLHSTAVASFLVAVFAGGSVLLTLGSNFTGHYLRANLALNLSLMFLGLVLRLKDEDGAAAGRRYELGGLALVFGAIVSSAILGGDRAGPLFTTMSFTSGYILAVLCFLVSRAHVLRLPQLFAWLGAISYSIYLFHEVVLSAADPALSRTSSGLSHLGIVILCAALSIVISTLVYFMVEKPSIRRGRAIVSWIRSRPDVGSMKRAGF